MVRSYTANTIGVSTGAETGSAGGGSVTTYSRTINITNPDTTNPRTEPVLVRVDTQSLISASKLSSDCKDIRFEDSSQNNLNYWLESGCNTTDTLIWVDAPDIPADSNVDITMTYQGTGTSRTDESSLANTFPLFASTDIGFWSKGNDINNDGGSGQPANGTALATWADNSGNNRNATQGSAGNRPTFDTADTVNGIPTISFDADGEFFDLSTHASDIWTKDMSMAIVAQTDVSNQEIVLYASDSGGRVNNIDYNGFGAADVYETFLSFGEQSGASYNPYYALQDGVTYSDIAGTGNATAYQVLIANSNLGGNSELFVNSGSAGTVVTPADNRIVDTVFIGHHAHTGGSDNRSFTGNMAEIMTFSRDLTSGELDIVNTYLNTKYELYSQSDLPDVTVAGSDTQSTGSSQTVVGYQKPVTITNNTGSSLTDSLQQISLDTSELISANKMRTDCGDLRVLDNDQTTELAYWIEGGIYECNTTDTRIWVRVPSIPTGDYDIYVRYESDSSSLTSTASLANTIPVLADSSNVLWLDASTGTNTITDAANVTSWTDQSGTGNDATQSVGGREPTFATNIANSRPAIDFAGTNDYLRVLDDPSLDGMSGMSIFMAYADPSIAADWEGVFSKRQAYDSNEAYTAGVYQARPEFEVGTNASRDSTTTTISNGEVYEIGLIYDGTLSSAQRMRFYLDGVLDATHDTPATTVPDVNPDLLIGGYQASNDVAFDGDFYLPEMLIFDKALSASEQEELSEYLNVKYAYDASAVASTTAGSEQEILGSSSTVTITDGTNTVDCENVVVVDVNTITCTTPASPITPGDKDGSVDVIVTNSDTQTAQDTFTYYYDIHLSGGVIPGTVTTSPDSLEVNQTGQTISSPINIKAFDNTTDLTQGLVCRNTIDYLTGGSGNFSYAGTLDANAQCITNITGTDLDSAGTVNVTSHVTIDGKEFSTDPVVKSVDNPGTISLSSVAPESIRAGDTLTLTGADFSGTLTVEFTDGGPTYNCGTVTVVNPTTATCVMPSLPVGVYSVTITNEALNSDSLVSALTVIDNIETTGLTAYYDAEHAGSYPGSGTTWFDISGNNNDATFGFGNSATAPGFVQSVREYLDFNGSTASVQSGVASNFSDSFTLETWVRRNTDASTGIERLFNIQSGNAERSIASLSINGNTAQAIGYAPTANSIDSGFIMDTDWQHVTITYDAVTDTMKMYVNGVEHGTSSVVLDTASADNIMIGTLLNASNDLTDSFDGDIAIARIYNDDLNQAQIESNFDTEKSRFGFTDGALQVNVPVTIAFGSQGATNDIVNLQVALSDYEFTDRRAIFGAHTIRAQMSDLSNGADIIPAENFSLSSLALNYSMGSGQNTAVANPNISFIDDTDVQNLIVNSVNNGGSRFMLTGNANLQLDAYPRTGTYTGTLTITVI
jgi:hypothetical protein